MRGALVTGLLMVLMSCGGPPEGDVFEANREATFDFAEKANFKFCKIVSDRVCESPDGRLVFHLPLDVILTSDGHTVSDDILITNEDAEDVVIDEYYVTLTDDLGNFYRADFYGPGGYGSQSQSSPALTLHSGGREKVRFVQTLKPRAGKVSAISIYYRLEDEADMTQVVVSYRPQTIYDIR